MLIEMSPATVRSRSVESIIDTVRMYDVRTIYYCPPNNKLIIGVKFGCTLRIVMLCLNTSYEIHEHK